MKSYRETYIRKAEVAQLIFLHCLYSQSGSHNLIFQGGTALRWCYGGCRVSWDLGFLTPLDPGTITVKLGKTLKAVEKEMAPHFGTGALSVLDKSTRRDTLKLFVDYRPAASREKISLKLEFEMILKNTSPETKNHVLSTLPAVSYLMTAGEFRIPRPNSVLVAETVSKILSDKVRALLERRYLKGRDIYDVWYLRSALNVAAGKEMIERKLIMYAWPFKALRGLDFFAEPTPAGSEELKTAIRQDLSRFLPPAALAVHQAAGFAPFLDTLRELFTEFRKAEVALP